MIAVVKEMRLYRTPYAGETYKTPLTTPCAVRGGGQGRLRRALIVGQDAILPHILGGVIHEFAELAQKR